jgi:tRNA G18 (ribose-2'-O)-methylase SpoU
LKAEGFTVVALTPAADAIDIAELARREPKPAKIAVLVGSEASGLATETLVLADERVRIPIAPNVDSLNLATASGIALHCLTT